MVTSDGSRVFTAKVVAELANVTYRQLDYWARQRWVVPSLEPAPGRRAPWRRYSTGDVVKLAALGHFGRVGADVAAVGAQLAALDMSAQVDVVHVLDSANTLYTVAVDSWREELPGLGRVIVFDPAPTRQRLTTQPAAAARGGDAVARRSA